MVQPGEEFYYGLNTDVLGYLIEVISGMPLDKYLQQKIFDPLGMKDTYFFLPKEKQARLVALYIQQGSQTKLRDTRFTDKFERNILKRFSKNT